MMGSKRIPSAAAELLNNEDKERVVDAASPSQHIPEKHALHESAPPGGMWISGVLGAVAIALVVLLIQAPTPKRQQQLASMQSQETLALDLYCVERNSERFILPPDGVCDASVDVEFRNRGSEGLYLTMVALVEGHPKRVVPIVRNLKLQPTRGTTWPLVHRGHDELRTMSRRIVALVSSSERTDEETLVHLEALSAGTPHHGALVRTWLLHPAGP